MSPSRIESATDVMCHNISVALLNLLSSTVVIFKTESSIRIQLLFHAFCLSDERVRLKFCESTVNELYHSELVHSFQVQRKIQNVPKFLKYLLSCVYRSNISIK